MFKKIKTKFNHFSGLYEPAKDSTELRTGTVKRFISATLNLEAIVINHEKDVSFDVATLAKRYGSDTSLNCDYADAMEALEAVLSDVNANMIIMAIEAIAKKYGYSDKIIIPEISQEDAFVSKIGNTVAAVAAKFKNMYDDTSDSFRQAHIVNAMAAMYKNLQLDEISKMIDDYFVNHDKTHKFKIIQGGIYYIDFTMGTGHEISGQRMAVVLASDKTCESGANILVAPITGGAGKDFAATINNCDIDTNPLKKVSNVNIFNAMAVDRARFQLRDGNINYLGKVKDYKFKEIMNKVGMMLGRDIIQQNDIVEIPYTTDNESGSHI